MTLRFALCQWDFLKVGKGDSISPYEEDHAGAQDLQDTQFTANMGPGLFSRRLGPSPRLSDGRVVTVGSSPTSQTTAEVSPTDTNGLL